MTLTIEQWLGEDNEIGIDIWKNKYQYNSESLDEWFDRVSGGDKDVRKLIEEKKFLFGGRVLSNRGIPNTGNYYNCFSHGYVEDSLTDILETNKTIGLTYQLQGGQGISLSKIRPKGASVKGGFTSDGIVPFMEIFNTTTESISQGGSRKGALMISLDIRHKQAEEFITIKTDLEKITKANLSLEIDNEFMQCVEDYYAYGVENPLTVTQTYGDQIIEYKIVPIKLYKLMMETVWDYGEPGCLFTDELRNYNFMEYVDEYKIETVNPCGEQPLKARTSCNLGSLNLFEFVSNPFTYEAKFNWEVFGDAIDVAIKALDDIIDENYERIPKTLGNGDYKTNTKLWRNIGLGVMGYADCLIALGLKYGSDEAIDFSHDLFEKMFKQSLLKSLFLASETTPFIACVDDDKMKLEISNSQIIRDHCSDQLRADISKKGLRNCSLLSIAPTGTISTMLNRSGGIEPNFAFEYTRKTDNLKEEYTVHTDILKQYYEVNPLSNLPEYFVSSKDIDWVDRIDTQAIIQRHIDTAISSTINLPQSTTLEEMEQLYLYAWQLRLKGITVFRDGCKRLGILTDQSSSDNTQDEELEQQKQQTYDLERGVVINVDDDVIGRKRKLVTGCGTLHCMAYFDPISGELVETYLAKGSTGGCNNFMVGLSRLMSYASRLGGTIDGIVDQLKSCGVCPSYAVRTATKHDTSKGACCPIAVGFALKEMYNEIQDSLGTDEWETINVEKVKEIKAQYPPIELDESLGIPCPDCGEELILEGGCDSCKACGYSSCS